MPAADGTLLSRYECKYLVSEEMAQEIRLWTAGFVEPDPFARRRPDRRYPICSLYLDSPDLRLYRTTVEGHKNRFKLRIRTYTENPRDPAFLEIKRRVDQVVLKRRAKVERHCIPELLTGRPAAAARALPPDAAEFLSTSLFSHARPCMRILYLREAYNSRNGDPVRITFDTELRCCPTSVLDLSHGSPDWRPVPLPGVILEIKFTDLYPSWVGELIGRFELHRQSVAKYILGVDEAIRTGAITTVAPMLRAPSVELNGGPGL